MQLKKLYLDHNQLTKLPHDLHKLGHSLTLLEDYRPNTLSIVLWAFCQLLAQAQARAQAWV